MTTAGTVNVQIGATFASTFKAAFGSAENQIGKLGSSVRAMDSKLQSVKAFRSLSADTVQAGYAWQAAKAKADDYARSISAAGPPTKAQARELSKLQKQAERAGEAFAQNRQELASMRSKLVAAGVSTKDLTTEQAKLERSIEATTNRMKALTRLGNAGVGKAFGEVGSQLRSVATQATIAGVGLGWFFKRNFIDVASEFERFKTILLTTEGSADKAQTAMNWISDFAAKTPYEMAQVTDAFVRLRAYGLDPTNGLLKALGDTSAAMGKDVMSAVEAIADAVTGENERLKEFGIKASKEGGKIAYNYTNRAGKQMRKVVDANNRAMIESTLTAIFNEKYAGAMDNLSTTWAGMVSNLKDQWSRFANNTMNAGLFDWMKTKLGGTLDTLNTMAENGELQAWAERTGAALTKFAQNAWELGSAIVGTTQQIAEFVGGWRNLGVLLVGLKFAPLIFSIGKLAWALGSAGTSLLIFATAAPTAGAAWAAFGAGIVKWAGMAFTAFRTLAAFMLTNPIGIALTALGVAGYLLWQNWDKVKGGLVAIWNTIKETAIAAFDAIKSAVGAVIDWLAEKTAWIFATVDKVKAAAGTIGSSIGSGWDKAKSFMGIGGPEGSTSPGASSPRSSTPTAPGSSSAAPPVGMQGSVAPVTPVPAAPAARTITQTSTVNAPITINGATDPQATAKAVRAELDKRERIAGVRKRGLMTDPVGL